MWPTCFLIAVVVNFIGAENCGTDWKLLPSTNYQYKVFCNRSTFEEAEATCEKHGGHLVSIHNEEENKFVYDLITPNKNQLNFEDYAWIGLIKDEEDNWQWMDGTNATFTKWSTDEPNNALGKESCAQMYSVSPPIPWDWDSNWNDFDCTEKMRQFVCKKSQDIQSTEAAVLKQSAPSLPCL